MSADIRFLPARKPARPAAEHPHVYHALLMRDDVSIGELMHALRFSGIAVTTDPLSGQTYLHRSTKPPRDAA